MKHVYLTHAIHETDGHLTDLQVWSDGSRAHMPAFKGETDWTDADHSSAIRLPLICCQLSDDYQ